MGRPPRGQNPPAKTPFATSVTESRMLDLIRNGKVARGWYGVGEASNRLRCAQSEVIAVGCGAQRWQLATYHAVVWVDGSKDGVTLHAELASAADEFFRVVADLRARHEQRVQRTTAAAARGRKKPRTTEEG